MKKEKLKPREDKADDRYSAGIIGENAAYGEEIKRVIEEGVESIGRRAKTYAANTEATRAGFVAEADHAATFNARSALDRSGSRAVLEPNGNHGDIRVVNGKEVIAEAEVKYYGTAEGTENAARGYGNKQRVVPADQVKKAAEIAKKRAAKELAKDNPVRQAVGREHKEVHENLTDRLSDGKRHSTPRTYKENLETTKKAGAGKLCETDVLPSMGETLSRSAASGAKSGAVVGAGISAIASGISNAAAVFRQEKSAGDAFADVALETTVATADSAVKGAVGSMVRAGGIQVAARTTSTVARNVLRSGGPAAAAIGGVEVIKDTILLAAGKIDGKEYRNRAKKTVISTGSGWAGAEAGAALGTMVCPGIGTVVFGVVGGLIGGIGGSWLAG